MKTAVREKADTAAVTVAAPKLGHAHHWVIASPEGEFSLGSCKVCGKTRKFPNSAEDNLWQRNVPQSRWTGRADSDMSSGY